MWCLIGQHMLPSNRQGDLLNHGDDHLGSWMCHALPSCRKITHHRIALRGRQKAEESSGSHANEVHNASLSCWELGRAKHHLPCHCLHAGVRSSWLFWHTGSVFVSKLRSIYLALQLHHKSRSSWNLLQNRGRVDNTRFWFASRRHLNSHSCTPLTIFS